MINSCWSTSTYVDMDSYIQPHQQHCKNSEEQYSKQQSTISIPKHIKRESGSISSWYNTNKSVSWNYDYACSNGIQVKKHSLYNFAYRQRKRSEQ